MCSMMQMTMSFSSSSIQFPLREFSRSSVTSISNSFSIDGFSDGLSTSVNFAMDPYSDEARSITEALGVSSEQHDTLSKHAELVVEWNERLNLISRKDCNVNVVFGRHILPSLALAALPDCLGKDSGGNPIKTKIVDIGTGGGFPGLPLAIIYPDSDFLLVDSVGKKLKAVAEMAAELELDNVQTHHGRAEEIVDDPIMRRKYKNSFDICVGRSVTSMPRFCFWIQDLLKNKKDEEGKLVYIIGGEVESSVLSRLQADVEIDGLLQCEGASDKRALILRALDVIEVAKESGETRIVAKKSKKKKKGPKSNVDGEWNKSKGGWAKKDNSVKKQRGYENFKRYGSD